MSTKEKILSALGCSLEDLSESRLLDILLDAYQDKKDRIEELESANVQEREKLHTAEENIRRELRQMRMDPLYGVHGDFFFSTGEREFCVQVQGGMISMFERRGGFDFIARPLSRDEWERK